MSCLNKVTKWSNQKSLYTDRSSPVADSKNTFSSLVSTFAIEPFFNNGAWNFLIEPH